MASLSPQQQSLPLRARRRTPRVREKHLGQKTGAVMLRGQDRERAVPKPGSRGLPGRRPRCGFRIRVCLRPELALESPSVLFLSIMRRADLP